MVAAQLLYRTLAAELRAAIQAGEILGGALLPSLREYAAQRRLSRNTVEAAYRLLEDEGYIVARPHSGFYVAETLPARRSSGGS